MFEPIDKIIAAFETSQFFFFFFLNFILPPKEETQPNFQATVNLYRESSSIALLKMKFPTQTKTSKPASVSRSSFQRDHMCVINGERRTYNLCLSLIKDEGRVGCNFLLTGQRSRLMMSVHRFDAVSQEGTRSGEKRLARGKLQKLFAVCPSALIVCTHVSVGFACEDTLKP